MSRNPPKTIYLRLYLAYCISALVVYVLLMALGLPWWHAGNHPVVVNLGAGSAQQIGLSYSPEEDPVILVPVGTTAGYHWKWAAELPPRPKYDLSMVFPEGTVGEVVFKRLELIQLKPSRKSSLLKIRDVPLMERAGIQLQKLVDGIRIIAEPGAVLELEVEVSEPTAYTWVKTWARASLGYLVCALILLFALASVLQFPDRVQAYRKRTPLWEVMLTLAFTVLGGALHVYLLNHAMPDFAPGKSDQHVELAIRMHDGLEVPESLTIDSLGSPGYAFFLSRVAGQSDWDLHAVVIAQGLLFCAGIGLVGLAITRLVNGWIVGPALVVACLSPAAVWANRHIGVESLGTTAVLFSLAAFLLILQTEKIRKWFAFILFGVVVATATTISSVWIPLFLLLPGMLIGTVIWGITTRRFAFWKLEVLWRTAAQIVMSTVIILVGGYALGKTFPGTWKFPNMRSSHLWNPSKADMFEAKAIQDRAELSAIINGRIDSDYAMDWRSFASNSTIHRSGEMLPLQMRMALMGRLTYWGFFLPDVEVAPNRNLSRNYTVRNSYPTPGAATGVQDSIASIMRQTDRAVFVQERRSNRHLVFYNQTIVGIYRWFYPILFFLGLAGWLAGLVDRKYLAGLFVLPFMFNILRCVYGTGLSSECIQSMDSLLLLGALAGLLGTNAKSLQKPKDETDRRTLRPIRPKRLLTRQGKTPFVHHGN